MAKYYAVGVTGYGSKQTAQFLGTIEARNLTEARRQGFCQYKDEWFDSNGIRQLAVVGKAGYERYWKELCEREDAMLFTVQGKQVTVDEMNARELMAMYDYYQGEVCNCSDGSLYKALDVLYNEIIRRMER